MDIKKGEIGINFIFPYISLIFEKSKFSLIENA